MLDWNSLYKSGRDFGILPDAVVKQILSYAATSTPKTFLDIGCGTGQLSRTLTIHGYQGVAIDASRVAIDIAKSQSTHAMYKKFDIEKDDPTTLNGPFGLITCKHAYAFMQHKQAFLQTAQTLLSQDGILAIITPTIDSVPHEKQAIAVDKEELLSDVSCYFHITFSRELKSGLLLILQHIRT